MSANAAFVQELFAVSHKWRNHFDARVRGQGLTLARARALMRLADRDGMTQRDLAELLEIETATLVRLLDGLAEQGFVERHPVEGDRRTNHVVLTEEGRRRADDLKAFADRLREELLAEATPDDIAAALRVLRGIDRRLSG